jgi:chromosome segregation ATPase
VASRSRHDDEVDRLYELPLEQFTKARNELARGIRSDDREAAERIAKLKKPTAPAWTLNQLARSHPKDIRAVLKTGAALREAQARPGARGLRKAAEEERAAVERLVGAAQDLLAGKPAAIERVRNTLHAAATDEELREQLERGRVSDDRESIGFGVATARSGDRTPELRKRLRSARSQQSRAERSREKAEKSLERLQDEAEDVRRRLVAAQRELRQARGAADKARAATGAIEAKLDRGSPERER